MTVAHGAFSQGMQIVTAYDTLGEEGLRHSLTITKPRAVFTEPNLLPRLMRVLDGIESVVVVVVNTSSMQKLDNGAVKRFKTAYPNVKILDFKQLKELGKDNMVKTTPPKPQDTACIMFTSGTGSTPKGVELTHHNIIAAVAGGLSNVEGAISSHGFNLRYLAYLPLAHIFEFVFEHAVMHLGGCLGYGSARTLAQANCVNCKGDILEFKPSFLVGIPAVWEGVRKGIVAQVEKGGFIARSVFWSALTLKRFVVTERV